jgi:hypothetical protein
MMPETKKRESLCVDAVNDAAIFMGTTWVGWVIAPPLAYLAGHFFGYKDAITVGIVCWFMPPIVARTEPHLFTAVVRSLFFGDYYDAD